MSRSFHARGKPEAEPLGCRFDLVPSGSNRFSFVNPRLCNHVTRAPHEMRVRVKSNPMANLIGPTQMAVGFNFVTTHGEGRGEYECSQAEYKFLAATIMCIYIFTKN